jgi:hypothetical protein
MAFDASREILNTGIHRYAMTGDGNPVSFADALQAWQDDDAFRSRFCELLAESPFAAYRWETPPVTGATLDRAFEFVLVDTPWLAGGANHAAFAEHFPAADRDGICVFENLGQDAVLVVPAPVDAATAYGHLAEFMRTAGAAQCQALWRIVGSTMRQRLSAKPLWLSTAGGGVAWLHVRLDRRPKYYSYGPYRQAPRGDRTP